MAEVAIAYSLMFSIVALVIAVIRVITKDNQIRSIIEDLDFSSGLTNPQSRWYHPAQVEGKQAMEIVTRPVAKSYLANTHYWSSKSTSGLNKI